MNLGKSLKYFDLCSYHINLNFDRQGEYMTTRIGGFTSILALLIMFLYSILKLNVMFLRTNTTVLSLPMEADTESLKTINF